MYFLAIVAKDDLRRGKIRPSYILCHSNGAAETRSPFRVYRANVLSNNISKALVRSVEEQDLLIDFLSSYRTRDHMHGAKGYHKEFTKKYYPEGALFWFPCNEYGVENGTPIFIKLVPDRNMGENVDMGFTRLKEALAYKPTYAELFSKTYLTEPLLESGIKPQMASAF